LRGAAGAVAISSGVAPAARDCFASLAMTLSLVSSLAGRRRRWGTRKRQRCSQRQPTCTLPRRKPGSTCRGGDIGPGFRRDRGPFTVSCPVGRQRRWGTTVPRCKSAYGMETFSSCPRKRTSRASASNVPLDPSLRRRGGAPIRRSAAVSKGPDDQVSGPRGGTLRVPAGGGAAEFVTVRTWDIPESATRKMRAPTIQ
jgi:hypothetical protein